MWVNLWFANRESLCQSPSPQREKWGNCSHFGWQNVGTFRLSTGHKHTKCQHPGCSEPCADFSDFVSFLEYFWSSFVSQSYHNTFSDIFRYQYIYIFSQKSLVYFPRGWFNLQPLSFLPPPPPEKKKTDEEPTNLPPPKKAKRPIFFGQKKAGHLNHPSIQCRWGGVAAALADRAFGEAGKPCEPTDGPPSDRAGDGRVTGCTGNGVVWYEFIWIKGWTVGILGWMMDSWKSFTLYYVLPMKWVSMLKRGTCQGFSF